MSGNSAQLQMIWISFFLSVCPSVHLLSKVVVIGGHTVEIPSSILTILDKFNVYMRNKLIFRNHMRVLKGLMVPVNCRFAFKLLQFLNFFF